MYMDVCYVLGPDMTSNFPYPGDKALGSSSLDETYWTELWKRSWQIKLEKKEIQMKTRTSPYSTFSSDSANMHCILPQWNSLLWFHLHT